MHGGLFCYFNACFPKIVQIPLIILAKDIQKCSDTKISIPWSLQILGIVTTLLLFHKNTFLPGTQHKFSKLTMLTKPWSQNKSAQIQTLPNSAERKKMIWQTSAKSLSPGELLEIFLWNIRNISWQKEVAEKLFFSLILPLFTHPVSPNRCYFARNKHWGWNL